MRGGSKQESAAATASAGSLAGACKASWQHACTEHYARRNQRAIAGKVANHVRGHVGIAAQGGAEWGGVEAVIKKSGVGIHSGMCTGVHGICQALAHAEGGRSGMAHWQVMPMLVHPLPSQQQRCRISPARWRQGAVRDKCRGMTCCCCSSHQERPAWRCLSSHRRHCDQCCLQY